jgi:NADH dehydrogenase
MRRIVVLGGGFAALNAIQRLEEALEGRRHIELTLLTDRAHFVYTPLLAHVVSGTVEVTDITIGFDEMLAEETTLRVETVESIDPGGRTIETDEGECSFDYLIFAPEGVVNWGETASCRSRAHSFDSPTDAASLRRRLDALRGRSDDRAARLAIIGGGRTGVELAAEIRRAHPSQPADKPLDLAIVERRSEILGRLPNPLQSTCHNWLAGAGVDIQTDASVETCSEGRLELADGEAIEVDAAVWCGGWEPPPLVDAFGPEATHQGRIDVDPYLHVADTSYIFAAGIAVAPDASRTRRVAREARQGRLAADNLVAELSGRTPKAWSADESSWLISLGSNEAVAYKNGTTLTGRAAWAFYRFVHTSLMPGALAKAGLLRSWFQEGFG